MNLSLILEMAAAAHPERVAVVCGRRRLTVDDLSKLADAGAHTIAGTGATHLAYLGTGGEMLPILLFSAAQAGVPFTPLNYRLSGQGIRELIERLPGVLVVVDQQYLELVDSVTVPVLEADAFLCHSAGGNAAPAIPSSDDRAVMLFTSGTTSRPKAVELTHNNLVSYVTGTVEFGSASAEDRALVCVPPYHIAGVGAVLSNLYAGRRVVYLREFSASEWIHLVQVESVTTATVVPTMLDRIISELDTKPANMPTLRNLAYGGAKVPAPLIRRALELLPEVGFVNAYGLTETSSTIAVLGPGEHRAAITSADESVIRRLGSVGQVVPGVEVEIRAEDGTVVGPGVAGELYVRGEQVSGRYAEIGSVLDEQGWFPTKDIAWMDTQRYLYIGGRSDDTIIRGGENIAPAEIEDVLIEHPKVREVVVVGQDDAGWGQVIVAVVVPMPNMQVDVDDIKSYARERLRGSRTPDRVVMRSQLPVNALGKVLRRQISDELRAAAGDIHHGTDAHR